MPGPAAAPPVEPLEDVTLEQYAGVTVALAEGFALDAVLTQEGIAPDVWPRADVAWKARLAGDGAGGPVFAAFAEKRGVAEDCLSRPVTPLDADLGAWLGFLKAFSAHAAPFDLLRGEGLGMNDIARLQRRWARRMEQDEALRKQAAEQAKKGAGPLPSIRTEAAKLKPFPWTQAPAKKKEESPAAPAVPKGPLPGVASVLDMSFYTYVSVRARLAEEPGNREGILRSMPFLDFPKVDATWQARFTDDPVLASDFRRLVEKERGRLRTTAKRGEKAPAPAPPAEPASSTSNLAPTPIASAVVSPLPAVAATAAQPALPGAAPALPVVRPAPAALVSTAPMVDAPRGPALPFAEAPRSPAPVASADAAPALPAVQGPARPSLSGTSLTVDAPRGPALPFATKKASASEETPPSAEAKPQEPPPQEAPRAPEAARPAETASPQEAPALTLEQHACLCCELAGAPERAAETLARYRVTPAQKVEADRRFAERFAREPGLRATWDSAYRTYAAWWQEAMRHRRDTSS